MGPGIPRGGDALLTAYARYQIQFKARQLSGKIGFTPSDQPDLEQELTLSLIKQADRYDDTRGASLDTFANRVIESAAKMILRSRRRLKRAAGYHAKSIEQDTVQVDGKNVPISEGNEVATDDDAAHHAAGAEMQVVLQHVVDALPPFHAAVANHLKEHSIAGTAEAMGVSRRQIYAAMAEIRLRCEQAGLGD